MDIEKLTSDIDLEQIKEHFSRLTSNKKIETLDFLLNGLGIENEQVRNADLFLRNYIYTSIIVRKHLIEISNRQSSIRKNKKRILDKESYAFKKLNYFQQLNEEAKAEIINFICTGINRYVAGIKNPYFDLIDRDCEQNMWLRGPVYDYLYNAQFYDPEYDFSTYVKFYSIPGVKIIDSFRNIEKYIKLKKYSPELYQQEIIKTVDENNIISEMANRVSSNYHVHERKEIFDSMVKMIREEKYLAFITMATIQLEGIFYDLVCIKYGKKERQGTLVDKVKRTFENSPVLVKTLYPYFAFDIPGLRNEVAHKGIVEGRNLKQTAYELVLDLNCILCLTEEASTDKFKKFIRIYDKLNDIEEGGGKNYKESDSIFADCFVEELYMDNIINNEYFWELLLDPTKYEEELDYYCPENLNDNEACLKDVVYLISYLVRSEEFWTRICDICNSLFFGNLEVNKYLVRFLEMLKKNFISVLTGEAKARCCQVDAKLKEIKGKQKTRNAE